MSLFADAIQRGTRGAQPAAAAVVIGTLYFVTDEGVLERSTGAAWESYSAAFAAAVAAFLATPSSANLKSALTDETGSGAAVFADTPTLVTPVLGTPTSGTLTNTTGFPIAQLAGAAAGILTWLATPSSANLKTAVTDETGSGALVFADTPTLVTPLLGTPTSGVLTNCIGAARFVRKTGDESISNTTLQDDNELLFAIAANEVFTATWGVFYEGSTTGDFKFLITAPTGATGGFSATRNNQDGSGGVVTVASRDFTTARAAGAGGIGTTQMIVIHSIIVNGANAGNVTLQWAQNATDGANATTVFTNSYVIPIRHV